MAPKKINIKERFSDGEIDLSMSDLQDVPVREIAIYKKAFSLDLSNNHLKTLSPNFASLTHLTKLDLSKNQLKELPENFGDLVKLKYLDLYQNQLQYLPLSFSKLKALKWLDLKDNALVPAVAKVSGPCLDAKQCQSCARDVVNFFVQVQEQIASDIELRQKQRQKQLEVNQQNKQTENKKSKKKEKNKQKQQNGPIKENVVKQSTKKTKKVHKIEVASTSNQSKLLLLTLWFLFIFFTVFILTSVNFKWTRFIQTTIERLFIQMVSFLPNNLQEYGLLVGTFVKDVHVKTGNVTNNVLHYVSDRKIYEFIYSKASALKETVQNKSKEFYQHYVAS